MTSLVLTKKDYQVFNCQGRVSTHYCRQAVWPNRNFQVASFNINPFAWLKHD